jgi:FixJ family two-component response regulator
VSINYDLTDHERRVVVARMTERSYRQIGMLLDLSEASVKMALCNARNKFPQFDTVTEMIRHFQANGLPDGNPTTH